MRRAANRPASLVLVAEDQPALFQIIGRHLDCYPVSGKGFDPVLLHSSGRIANQFMTIIEHNAVTRVRQYLKDKTLKLQELFLSQVVFLRVGPSAVARVE